MKSPRDWARELWAVATHCHSQGGPDAECCLLEIVERMIRATRIAALKNGVKEWRERERLKEWQ